MDTKEKTAQVGPRLLDTISTASYLSISPSMVAKMVRAKKLKPVRFGRRVLFDVRELDRLIEKSKA